MTKLLCLTSHDELNTKTSWGERNKNIKVIKLEQAESHYGAIVFHGQKADYCSYQNYQLQIN